MCSQISLLTARVLPTEATQPIIPAMFEEPIDTAGQAIKRNRQIIHPLGQIIEVVDRVVEEVEAEQSPHVSRKTAWRKRKAVQSEASENGLAVADVSAKKTENGKKRKAYSCTPCNKPMSSGGHTQFKGVRHCPENTLLSKTAWLEEQRANSRTS